MKISWICIITVLLQPISLSFNRKYFNRQSFFSSKSFSFIFFAHPLHGLRFVVCIIIFLISQLYPTRFQWNLSYPLHYTYSTSTAIFRLILVCNITPQHTLNSRVKDSITQPSFCLQILIEDWCVNGNFASIFLWKSNRILFMGFQSLNLNDLFMLLMH